MSNIKFQMVAVMAVLLSACSAAGARPVQTAGPTPTPASMMAAPGDHMTAPIEAESANAPRAPSDAKGGQPLAFKLYLGRDHESG